MIVSHFHSNIFDGRAVEINQLATPLINQTCVVGLCYQNYQYD